MKTSSLCTGCVSLTLLAAGAAGVMDASAISLARENNIPVIVFSIKRPGAFAELMQGRGECTVVMGKEVKNA